MLTRHTDGSGYFIRAYDQDSIKIGDQVHTTSLLVSTDSLTENWTLKSLTELAYEDFASAEALNPDILLFGSGKSLVFPDFDIIRKLRAKGISLEVMDTAAACRTFNVLRSEDRHVVAILMI